MRRARTLELPGAAAISLVLMAIITAAVLKLFPKPKGREVAWAALQSPEDALALFNLVEDRAGSALTSFELIGRRPLAFLERHGGGLKSPLGLDCPWQVLMEISSGRSEQDARDLIEGVLAAGMENGLVADAVISSNLTQARTFWQMRETLPETQKREGASIKHDISVPVSAIPEFIHLAAGAVEKVCPGARVVCFGHMGDGNLHYNITQPRGMDPAAFLALYKPMNQAVHEVVRALDGSISAEHGIGQLKRDELLATAPPVAIDLMRRIKAAFDPAGIMNPGKVLP
mgnify:FL=1